MKCDRIFSLPFIKQIEKFKLSDTQKHRKTISLLKFSRFPAILTAHSMQLPGTKTRKFLQPSVGFQQHYLKTKKMLSKFNLGEAYPLTKSLIQAGPRLQSLDQNAALQDLSLSPGQVLPKPEEFSNAEIRIYSTDRSIHHLLTHHLTY